MSIRFQCDHCHRHVKVESRHAGKQSKCPSCQGILTIPYPHQIETAIHDSAEEIDLAGAADQNRSPASAEPNFPDAIYSAPPIRPVAPSADSDDLNPYQSPHSGDPWDGLADDLDGSGNRVVYAGFWLRVCASIVDGFITTIFQWAICLGIGIPYMVIVNSRDLTVTIIGIGVQWLYSALMECSSHQATLGKMALGIRVTDLDGRRIGFGRATGRHFGKILSAMLLCIGFMMAAFTAKKQALHDLLVSTLVVRN
jgi:uncharacterized RDD family membrane protein YckC